MTQKKHASGDPAKRLVEAVGHHQAGRLAEAEAGYRAVLAARPDQPDALHLLGVLFLQQGRPDPAAEMIAKAIRHDPNAASYHDNLGSALAALGRAEEAAGSHRRAVALQPDFAKARYNLGNALLAAGRPERAARAFRTAVALVPDYVKAYYNLGNALRDEHLPASAVRAFEHAVRLAPGMAEAHNNLGDVLASVGRVDEAIAHHRTVVLLRPDDANALYNLGAALQHKGALEEAEIVYREALRRAPGHVGALNNLGSVLKRLGQPEQAALCHRQALALAPDFAEALYNLGNALQALGRLEEAEACYEETLKKKPDLATAHHNLALMALARGDLERGWWGHDRRFAARKVLPDRRFPIPQWHGEALRGRRLLIWREQGVGDEILFASCYDEVLHRVDGPVTIECDRRLVPLFARSFPAATVRPESCDADGQETIRPPDADLHVPAGSLPHLLRPDLRDFPVRPSWLVPDPVLVAAWRERLAALGPGLRVGICWRSQLMTEERVSAYTTLDQWGPVLTLPGVTIVNLQYGDCAAEIKAAEERFGVRIHRWADLDLKDDFDGVAALAVNLDLVVTVATSAGEMAGALGVPVWRIGAAGEWSALGTGVRPWYPTMRLLRPRPGAALADVLARVGSELRSTLAAARTSAAEERQVEEHLSAALDHHRAGRPDEAAAGYAAVLDLRPRHADALHLLGVLLHQAGRSDDAVDWIAKSLAADPDFPQAWNNLGLVLQVLDRFVQARRAFAFAVALRPDFAEALTHLGILTERQGDRPTAERWHRRALHLRPENAGALTNLGSTLERMGRFEEATRLYWKALAVKPDLPDAHNNLATMAKVADRFGEALVHSDRALRLDPGHALAGWNHGLLSLQRGDIATGWAGYARRFSARELQRARRIPLPEWRGEPLGGRRLMVWGEQGVGDEILFASCYADLAQAGGVVILECDRRLVPLFRRAFPWAIVRPESTDATGRETMARPDADLHCPAGALPGLLRRSLTDFPARPAFLTADPALAAAWGERLAALGPGLRVGIAWRSQVVDAYRQSAYTTLDQWGPVFAVPGVTFVTLQYGDCAAEIKAAEARFGVPLHRWADLDLKDDFEGTAALIANLDLVVTPATAAGELAGALGVPTWRLGARDWTFLGTAARPWFPAQRPVSPRAGESLADALGRTARDLDQARG